MSTRLSRSPCPDLFCDLAGATYQSILLDRVGVSIFNGIEERPRDRRENLEVWWSEVLKVGGRMRRPFDPRLTAPVMSDVET
jgi:hypothetical protein